LNPGRQSSSCILLDVEGTTTSISFVYDVLFPYARRHVEEFLQQHSASAAVQEVLSTLRAQRDSDEEQGLMPPHATDAVPGKAWGLELSYVGWLMDRDSKATPLKTLQGMIWEEGYSSGRLKSHVFPDVPEVLKRWKKQGRTIAIFSSGSVLAQKQLFAHTVAGDLSSYIDRYFDTTSGAKRNSASYRVIAGELGRASSEILFISDVTEELDAAAAGGMNVLMCMRPGNRPQAERRYTSVRSLEEIL
jgi:enolase-phosphatase E1